MSITVFVLPFIIFGLLVLLATAPIVTSGKDRDCPLFTKGFIDFLTGDDTPGKLFTLNFTTGMEARFGLQGWLGGADDDDGNCDCNEQDKANSGNRQCNAPGAIRLHNWGGQFQFSTQNIQYPRTTADVQKVVRGARKLRAVGTRHSFTHIADSCDSILSTLGMNTIVRYNASVPSVTVQPGITYADLGPALYANGYSLANMAAIAELTVGGAISTCAHGSGKTVGNLATQVLSSQLVLANGTLVTYRSGQPELKGVACGLGAFGVLTEIELQLEPAFNVTYYTFLNMSLNTFYKNVDNLQNMGYNVHFISFLTSPDLLWDQVWLSVRSGSAQDNNLKNLKSLYGAQRTFVPSGPFVVDINVEQPSYIGLLKFRIGTTGTDGNEIQNEYFFPYKYIVPALKAMQKISTIIKGSGMLVAMVIRTVAGDDLWLSEDYSYNKEPIAVIGFVFSNNATAYAPIAHAIEQQLKPFGARPHWGKNFTMPASDFLTPNIYPKLGDFKKLAEQLDPTHKFRNKFLEENVFATINSTKSD